jgi:hypothetical protein
MLSCVRRDATASRSKIPDWFLNFSPPSSLSERAGGKIPLFGDRRINHGCVPNRNRQDCRHAGNWRRPWRKPWSSAGLPRNLVTKKLRYYRAFNLEQCDLPVGVIDKLPKVETHEHDPIDEAELIVANMPQRPALETAGSKAFTTCCLIE